MRTAIYIEDGIVQLVMTPESEFEKNALSTFEDKPLDAHIKAGSFYECAGGWVRQSHGFGREVSPYELGGRTSDRSLILVARPTKED